MWERSFVAVSVLGGASLEEALDALPEGSVTRLGDLAAKLHDARRATKAQALATAAQEIMVAIGEVTWR
ncbi:MAG: hypothetical protein KF819_26605 [Labilithrix sp.]|nr:hypothetical protein [Labilithrix sp.]